jgi:hypothetical protein
MTATWINQHGQQGRLPEEDWYPRDLEDLLELRQAVIDAGVTARTADRLIAWVLTRSAGEEDSTSGPTRSSYRKVLAELPGPGPSSPDRRRRKDRGAASLHLVPGLAGAAGAGALAGAGASAQATVVGGVVALLYVTAGYMHYRPFVVVVVVVAPLEDHQAPELELVDKAA